jgi:hypothetical protein
VFLVGLAHLANLVYLGDLVLPADPVFLEALASLVDLVYLGDLVRLEDPGFPVSPEFLVNPNPEFLEFLVCLGRLGFLVYPEDLVLFLQIARQRHSISKYVHYKSTVGLGRARTGN